MVVVLEIGADNIRSIVNAEVEDGKLDCLNEDPQIHFNPPDDMRPGWYRFELDIESPGPKGGAKIYLNFGDGFLEEHSTPLNRDVDGKLICRVRIGVRPLGIRLDPTDRPEKVTFRSLFAVRENDLEILGKGVFRAVRTFTRDPQRGARMLKRGVNMLVGAEKFSATAIAYSPIDAAAPPDGTYDAWIRRFDYKSQDRPQIEAQLATLAEHPLISIVMPVYNTPQKLLDEAIASVRDQVYGNWELCIADDASPDDKVKAALKRWSRTDPRIRVSYREDNGHISEASNTALEMCSGPVIALMDHDDRLHPLALAHLAAAAMARPDAQIFYSDEDKIDLGGNRSHPYFKGGFNRDLLFCHNMTTHLIAYREELIRKVGGWTVGLEGSQDYDLCLKALDHVRDDQVVHLPHILYHWRMLEGSVALDPSEKQYAHARARQAIQRYFDRNDIDAKSVEGHFYNLHNVEYTYSRDPLVSIIICTRNGLDLLTTCVMSILERTEYPNFEIVIVDNQSDDPALRAWLRGLQSRHRNIVTCLGDFPFNFSKLNNRGSRFANGEYLVFLNNDMEVISPDWLDRMMMHMQRSDVGAVGLRLLYEDLTIQHAGLVTGLGGAAAAPYVKLPRETLMNMGKAQLTQAVAAVTGACLGMRADLYHEVGGMDEELFGVAYNDVDLCLKVKEQGKSVIYEPRGELFHYESKSRGVDEGDPVRMERLLRERDSFIRKWGDKAVDDPYYSHAFDLGSPYFHLAFPPRRSILDLNLYSS